MNLRFSVSLHQVGHGQQQADPDRPHKDHYDWFFERTLGSDTLVTFATDFDLACVWRLADHRRKYLTYSGPISDDRGQSTLLATGTYEVCEGASGELDQATPFIWQIRQLDKVDPRLSILSTGERWCFLHSQRPIKD